jgi:hypothetical protein
MTDSNIKNKRFITPEKSAILLPVLISSFISLIVVSAFVIPRYIKSNKINNEYKEFLRKKNELPNLKAQYKIINEKLEKLNKEKYQIINLISGTSNLETFLSRLGNLALKHNINISSISPKSSIMYVESQNSDLQDELNLNSDPLLVEGVKRYNIELNFKANFNDLLSFFRDLEFQENVILFKDINIASKKENNNEKTRNIPAKLLDISLKMDVYGKI